MDQNLVRGGLARFHSLSYRELETEANVVADRFIRRWCQERQVPLESVNVLVVSDLCRLTKLSEKKSGAIEAFFRGNDYFKLVFPPDVLPRTGYKKLETPGREATGADDDDGELEEEELPGEVAAIGTQGTLESPQKKRPACPQSMPRIMQYLKLVP